MPPTLLVPGNLIVPKKPEAVPIEYILEYIDKRIKPSDRKKPGDCVLILRSKTGSGKTTIIAPYLYKKYSGSHGSIINTQPTILTTTEVVKDLPKYNPFLKLGKNLGYATGESAIRFKGAGVLYVTVGILLQYLKTKTVDEFCSQFGFVLIDEVHKRDVQVDTTLFYLKKLTELTWNKNCPFIVLMSATIEPEPLQQYFSSDQFIDVEGQTFPIQENWLKTSTSSRLDSVMQRIHTIGMTQEPTSFRDIIVFVHIDSAAKEIAEKIYAWNQNKQNKMYPIVLNGSNYRKGTEEFYALLSDCTQLRIDNVVPYRKIIISTEFAETGITINNLKYCIDTGLKWEVSYSPRWNIQTMYASAITQAGVMQRRGRVGREAPGVWYPMFSKTEFNAMAKTPLPTILFEDNIEPLLASIVRVAQSEVSLVESTDSELFKTLPQPPVIWQKNQNDQNQWKFISRSIWDVNEIDWMQSPSEESLHSACLRLYSGRLIDMHCQPTLFGFYADKIPMCSIESSAMILAGYIHGANIKSLVTIASAIFVGFKLRDGRSSGVCADILNVGESNSQTCFNSIFKCELIDWVFHIEHISTMNPKQFMEYCSVHKLSYSGVCELIGIRDRILICLLQLGLNCNYNSYNIRNYSLSDILRRNIREGMIEVNKLKKCIFDGWKKNIIQKNKQTNLWRTLSGVPLKLNKNSASVHWKDFSVGIACEIKAIQGFNSGGLEASADFVSSMDSVCRL
jgi:HrpA-like RNA helicase